MRNRSIFWLVGLAVGASCTTDPVPPPSVAVALAVVTQPSPAAQAGIPLPVQPVVELRGAAGQPVATRGVLVTATLASGAGTVSGTSAIRTDAEGRARYADLVISGAVGSRTLRFSSPGLTATVSATIALEPGPPASLLPAGGTGQTAPAGTPVPEAPAVLVQDSDGNPVPGVAVEVAVLEGGGSVSSPLVTSGADGVARLQRWTLGPVVGVNRLAATVGTIQIEFTATAVVGPAARLAVVAGAGQAGVVAAAVPTPPAVKVTDAFDNPVAGVTVTFAVATGGGSLTGATPTTDATGTATVGSWVLGLAPGTQSLTVSRSPAPPLAVLATASHFAVTSVAAGGQVACAVSGPGSGFCWGDNAAGQHGSGTVGDSASTPRPVFGGLQLQSVTLGLGHACGLTVDGIPYCWGVNSSGQLGDGTTISRTTPAVVSGGKRFTQIVAGDLHTCALDTGGAAWCWGNNGSGRLGDGTTASRTAPTAVQGGHAFVEISSGALHTCGLQADGQVLCWGSNQGGRLGDGSTAPTRTVPTATLLPAGVTGFTSVTAGGLHSCAVASTGDAYCWGSGGQGVLGTGGTGAQSVPTAVVGGLTFSRVVAGPAHTCGMEGAGAVYCWGGNTSGRLGDGTGTARTVPTAVVGGLQATALALGAEHTCARSTFGSAICWGRGQEGQVGDGANQIRLSPTGVTPP